MKKIRFISLSKTRGGVSICSRLPLALQKKILPCLLVFCLVISALPNAFAAGENENAEEVVNASSWEEVKAAITNATSDITINLTADSIVSAAYSLSSEHTITITSTGGYSLSVGKILTVKSHLVLKDINIKKTASLGYIGVSGGTLDVYNVYFKNEYGVTPNAMLQTLATTSAIINIYSGTFDATYGADTTSCALKFQSQVEGSSINFYPTGKITVIGTIRQLFMPINIIPQPGYAITSATWNGESITPIEEIWTNAGADTETIYSGLSIEVAASGSSETKVLTNSNFTGPSADYFTTAGITVTPSEDDLSFTVACDNACVVAKDNGDGTYTRLTGEAVADGYKFTATSASDKIVVALNGDANCDGVVDAKDATLILRAYAYEGEEDNSSFSQLGSTTSDANCDGAVDAKDATLILRAYAYEGDEDNSTIYWTAQS